MARELNRKRPFVEVFGEVDENEKGKDGKQHIPHRFRQFGMLFDDAGQLIGDELDVPPEEETADQMRERITREVTLRLEREHRENLAELAKTGQVSDSLQPGQQLIGRPSGSKK